MSLSVVLFGEKWQSLSDLMWFDVGRNDEVATRESQYHHDMYIPTAEGIFFFLFLRNKLRVPSFCFYSFCFIRLSFILMRTQGKKVEWRRHAIPFRWSIAKYLSSLWGKGASRNAWLFSNTVRSNDWISSTAETNCRKRTRERYVGQCYDIISPTILKIPISSLARRRRCTLYTCTAPRSDTTAFGVFSLLSTWCNETRESWQRSRVGSHWDDEQDQNASKL